MAAQRQLSLTRWCSDFPKGCCAKDQCSLPKQSDTVLAGTKEKDSAYKLAAAARQDSRGRGMKKIESGLENLGWRRSRSRN